MLENERTNGEKDMPDEVEWEESTGDDWDDEDWSDEDENWNDDDEWEDEDDWDDEEDDWDDGNEDDWDEDLSSALIN